MDMIRMTHDEYAKKLSQCCLLFLHDAVYKCIDDVSLDLRTHNDHMG